MDRLEAYCADGDAFSLWVVSDQARASRVEVCMRLVLAMGASEAPTDLCVGRDAALTLFQIASEGGFPDTAAIFYAYYEQCCRRLLGWL